MKCRTDCPDANETTARNNKACRNNLRGMTALLAKVQSEIQWNTHGAQGESIQVKPRLAGRMVIIILLSEQTDFHKLAKAYGSSAISTHRPRALRLELFNAHQSL